MKNENTSKTKPIPTRFRTAEIARMDRAIATMGIHNRSAIIKLGVHVVLSQIESGKITIPQQAGA
jgi:hypothetical protein